MIPTADLHAAAERFGTPLYVYDAAELDAALGRVRAAFGDARLFYAMKANPNLSLLRRLAAAGVGAECVSAGEIARAEKVGLTGGQLIVNGPAKLAAEYAAGARLGATFVVDREEEVGLLPPRSRALVRVNPALEVSTHDHLATGAAGSKFGVTPAQAINFTLGFLAGTFLLSPDLDLSEGRVDSKRRWGVLGFLWVPYGRLFSHRGLSHTWLLGPLTRLAYVAVILAVVAGLVRVAFPAWTWPALPEPVGLKFAAPLLLGYYLSQWLHLIADGVHPDHGVRHSLRKLRRR